jgi:hypothetical protein
MMTTIEKFITGLAIAGAALPLLVLLVTGY